MSAKYLVVLFVVGIASFVLHELAHGLAMSLLGYDAYVSANHSGPVRAESVSDLERIITSAAGPGITFLQALAGLWLVMARGSRFGFCLVFSAFMMRLVAGAVSLSHPNDEALVSMLMGWPVWLLPALVIGLLAVMAVFASRRLGLGWKSWLAGWVVMSMAISVMVMGEPFLPTLYLPPLP